MTNEPLTSARSSSLRPLLLFLAVLLFGFAVPVFSAAAFIHEPADTIIIGGKRLVVDREVIYDTLATRTDPPIEQPKLKKRKRPDTWRAHFEVHPGFGIDEFNSTLEDYLTVNEYIGSSQQVTGHVNLAAGMQYKPGKSNLRIHFGVGIDYLQTSGRGYDASALGDSLYAFESPSLGSLNAIERFRFPIGAEFDTTAVNLRSSAIRAVWMTLPIGVFTEPEISKKFHLRFGAGVNLRLLIHSELPDIQFLPSIGAAQQSFKGDQLSAFNTFSMAPWAHGGVRYAIDRNWWISAGVRAAYPVGVFNPDEIPIGYRLVQVSAVLGLEFVFGK